jgi:GAF domain-containing protein
MKHVMDTLKINEEIARKFMAVEKALDSACTPCELFEILLRQLGEVFNIPFVWFTFVSSTDDEELASRLALTDSIREQVGILDEASFTEIFPQPVTPVLANENVSRFYKMFPKNRKYFLKSIAVVPLTLHGVLIGSLNLGDALRERYSVRMDTSLLQQLAGKISEHLGRMVSSKNELPVESDANLRCSGGDPGVSGSE